MEDRLSVLRYRLSDALDDIFYRGVSQGEKIVYDLDLYLPAVLL